MSSLLRNSIRNFLRKSMLEDEQSDQNIATSVSNIKQSYLRSINIEKYLDVLKNKFAVNPVKYLDSGNNGFALLDDKNRVIKVTTDRSEAVEGIKYKGHQAVHLPFVHNIIKINDSKNEREVYIIIKDYVLQNKSFIKLLAEQMLKLEIIFNFHFVNDYIRKNELNEVKDNFRQFYNSIIDGEVEDFVIKAFQQYLVDVRSKNNDSPRYAHVFGDKKNLWLFNELVELAHELNKFGIDSVDFDASNFGLKNKKLVYLDVGFGDYFGSDGKEKGQFDAEINEDAQEYTNNVDSDPDLKDKNLRARPIDAYLKVIKNKLNINLVKYLGGKGNGYAFLTDSGTVLKITSDRSEVVEAQKIINKKPVHLPQVFKTYKLKTTERGGEHSDVYIILKEYILANPAFAKYIMDIKHNISNALNDYIKNRMPGTQAMTTKYASQLELELILGYTNERQLKDFINFLNIHNYHREIWYLQEIVELAHELETLGLQSGDINTGNVGIRNKKLVLFDFGSGDYNGDGSIHTRGYDAEVH